MGKALTWHLCSEADPRSPIVSLRCLMGRVVLASPMITLFKAGLVLFVQADRSVQSTYLLKFLMLINKVTEDLLFYLHFLPLSHLYVSVISCKNVYLLALYF